LFVEIDAHRVEAGTRAPENGPPPQPPRLRKNVEHTYPPVAAGLLSSTWYLPFKAAWEFGLALVMLVAAAPIIAVSALLVKLTSRGPALYTQTRVGKDGHVFTIYKIRTMIHNCESLTGPRWAIPGDPRVTRVGRLLRLTHLDELPQLLNVLKGDMGLIGPRPERPELEQGLARYRERLTVRPGLTGLAQIQLPPDTDLDSVRRKLACDLYYIEHLGPRLDLSILMCTVFYVFGLPSRLARKLFQVPSSAVAERSTPVPVLEGAEAVLRRSA
jgi:lipopolysaccharide/colanic/teichoic acid biosynthesis glycosyltransferase